MGFSQSVSRSLCYPGLLLDQLTELLDVQQDLLHVHPSVRHPSPNIVLQASRMSILCLTSLLLMRLLAASAAFSSAVRALFLPATLDIMNGEVPIHILVLMTHF